MDGSALMAIALNEPTAASCIEALTSDSNLIISAVSIAEALVVAQQRNVAAELASVLERFGFNVVPVTDATARRIAEIYGKWGRGNHSAALNFGDCFSYQVAVDNDCSLLYVGNDFAKTDVPAALPA